MRICLVSRELYPYVGGGIAPIVTAAAAQLAEVADEVVVVTSSAHRERHEELTAAADPGLLPANVELLFAEEPEPDAYGATYTHMHAYSANVHTTLRERYADVGGPDILEFADYLGEGFVTIQAKHTAAPWLRDTTVCVRLHTTSELCAVLDGRLADDFGTRALLEMERYALKHADRLLWSGGDVYETYRRYYGDDNVAPGVRIRDAFLQAHDPVAAADERTPLAGTNRHVRLLFVGRMERRKGIQNLFRAIDRLGRRGDLSLTVLGGDTPTGPTATSLESNLRLAGEGDVRITFAEQVPRAEVPSLIRHHDVVVIPSLWECWPNVGREALMLGRPLLTTPVGGLVDMAVPGRSGWVAKGSTTNDLVEAIADLLSRREEIDELIASGRPHEVFEELTDRQALIDGYRGLVGLGARRPGPARRTPGDRRVSVVVPYFRLDAHIAETLASIEDQTHPSIETIVVNDGSLRDEDAFLYDLAEQGRITLLTQPNSGLGPARNLGVELATGAYVLPLDADDTIDPTFVSRCLDALDRDPDMAYATTWVQYMDEDGTPFGGHLEGYLPYGNWSSLIHDANVGGTCSSVFRREVFDHGHRYAPELVSYEDWLLYWQMHDAGHHGAVIPERLFHYRVRRRSMMRRDGASLTAVIHEELRALASESRVRWTRS